MTGRSKIEFARDLRKNQTETEDKLWWLLRKKNILGIKFRRQHVISGFVLDFYCPAAKLGIELDGKVHLRQREYDEARQEVIENRGIKVMRFKNEEIINNSDFVLNTIISYVEKNALERS